MSLKTYKNDDSFFTTLVPQESCYGAWPIQKWLLEYSTSKFRLIKDDEIDNDRMTMAQVQEIYPGIATIGITMDPWARVVYKFEKLSKLSNEDKAPAKKMFPDIDLDNFESMVKTTFTNPIVKDSKINIFQPQLHWLSQSTEAGIEYATFIIRGEYVNKDIKMLKDYFCITDDSEIEYNVPKINYKTYYNTETKDIITNFFKEDIDYFKYKFES
jgi:hypothetical protein